MLTKIVYFVHSKVQPSNIFHLVKAEYRDKFVNSYLPKYLTNPISGRQTTIPLNMIEELHENFYPSERLKSKNTSLR